MSSFFRGLLESLSPAARVSSQQRVANVPDEGQPTIADVQSIVAQLAVDVATASTACDRIERAFDAVVLGVYKSSRGTA